MAYWGVAASPRPVPAWSTQPVKIKVHLPELPPPSLVDGIRTLYQKCHFYDVYLVAGKSRFPAHQAMLAASSPKLRDLLCGQEGGGESRSPARGALAGPESEGGREGDEGSSKRQDTRHPELHLPGISSAEAMDALLNFVYGLGKYRVICEEANMEVLRFAKEFDIPLLQECAVRWLGENLTVANALSRLATCKEFGLTRLAEQIQEKIMGNAQALQEVSRREVDVMMKHPEILQSLLLRIAQRSSPATKRQAPAKTQQQAKAAKRVQS